MIYIYIYISKWLPPLISSIPMLYPILIRSMRTKHPSLQSLNCDSQGGVSSSSSPTEDSGAQNSPTNFGSRFNETIGTRNAVQNIPSPKSPTIQEEGSIQSTSNTAEQGTVSVSSERLQPSPKHIPPKHFAPTLISASLHNEDIPTPISPIVQEEVSIQSTFYIPAAGPRLQYSPKDVSPKILWTNDSPKNYGSSVYETIDDTFQEKDCAQSVPNIQEQIKIPVPAAKCQPVPKNIPPKPKVPPKMHLNIEVRNAPQAKSDIGQSRNEMALQHLINAFCVDEKKYFHNTLLPLTEFSKNDSTGNLPAVVAGLDNMKTLHDKIQCSVDPENSSVEQIADIFLSCHQKMECYTEFVRASRHISILPSKFDKKIVECIQVIHRKPQNYTQIFESWLKFDLVETDEKKLQSVISKLKSLSKETDNALIIDVIRKSPFNLNFFHPLKLYDEFKLKGRGFKEDKYYTLLLFNDLLLFTEANADFELTCIDSIRMEYIMVVKDGDDRHLKIVVTYGQRRGSENIILIGSSKEKVDQWFREIHTTLLNHAYLVKQMSMPGKNNLS